MRKLKRDERVKTSTRTHTHTVTHFSWNKHIKAHGQLCMLSELLLVKHCKWNLCIRLNCQSDGDRWLKDLSPSDTQLPLETNYIKKRKVNNTHTHTPHTHKRMGKECMTERADWLRHRLKRNGKRTFHDYKPRDKALLCNIVLQSKAQVSTVHNNVTV